MIDESHYGPDHFEVATTLFHLAVARESLGNLAQALQDFERVHRICEVYYGSEHGRTKLAHKRLQALRHKTSPPTATTDFFEHRETAVQPMLPIDETAATAAVGQKRAHSDDEDGDEDETSNHNTKRRRVMLFKPIGSDDGNGDVDLMIGEEEDEDSQDDNAMDTRP